MKCSNCGYYNNFSNKICNLCGTLLMPKSQIIREAQGATDIFLGSQEKIQFINHNKNSAEVLHPAKRNAPDLSIKIPDPVNNRSSLTHSDFLKNKENTGVLVKKIEKQNSNHDSVKSVTNIEDNKVDSVKEPSLIDSQNEQGFSGINKVTVKSKICLQGHINDGANIFCNICGEELFETNNWKDSSETLNSADTNSVIWRETEPVVQKTNWGFLKFFAGSALGFAFGVYYGVKLL